MCNRRHTGGFLFLELALTLGLVALIATLSYPAVHSIISFQALKAETRRFASLLQKLSSEALQRETKIDIELSATDYRVLRPGREDEGHFASAVQAKFQATNQSSLSFYPSGAASPATVIFSKGERECIITLSLRGRVASECL